MKNIIKVPAYTYPFLRQVKNIENYTTKPNVDQQYNTHKKDNKINESYFKK